MNGIMDDGYVIPQVDGGNDFCDDDADLVPHLVSLSPSTQSPKITDDSTSGVKIKVILSLSFLHSYMSFSSDSSRYEEWQS